MKVVISVDMEGVCGVVLWVQVSLFEFGGLVNGVEYEKVCVQMICEVVVVVEGVFVVGVSDVLVNDSYDIMCNFLFELLFEWVCYMMGNDKLLSMVQGVQEEGVGVLLFVGLYVCVGSMCGLLVYIWNGFICNVCIGGVDIGEYGFNVLFVGYYGVLVVFVLGDDVVMGEICVELGEGVEMVVVKEGLSSFVVIYFYFVEVVCCICVGVEVGVCCVVLFVFYIICWFVFCQFFFDYQVCVDVCEWVLGVICVDVVIVGWESENVYYFFQIFCLLVKVVEVWFNG